MAQRSETWMNSMSNWLPRWPRSHDPERRLRNTGNEPSHLSAPDRLVTEYNHIRRPQSQSAQYHEQMIDEDDYTTLDEYYDSYENPYDDDNVSEFYDSQEDRERLTINRPSTVVHSTPNDMGNLNPTSNADMGNPNPTSNANMNNGNVLNRRSSRMDDRSISRNRQIHRVNFKRQSPMLYQTNKPCLDAGDFVRQNCGYQYDPSPDRDLQNYGTFGNENRSYPDTVGRNYYQNERAEMIRPARKLTLGIHGIFTPRSMGAPKQYKRKCRDPKLFDGQRIEWCDYIQHFLNVCEWNEYDESEMVKSLKMAFDGTNIKLLSELDKTIYFK